MKATVFIQLIRPVDDLRLRAAPGLVTAVVDDFGGELVAAGQAVKLTLAEFRERLREEAAGQVAGQVAGKGDGGMAGKAAY